MMSDLKIMETYAISMLLYKQCEVYKIFAHKLQQYKIMVNFGNLLMKKRLQDQFYLKSLSKKTHAHLILEMFLSINYKLFLEEKMDRYLMVDNKMQVKHY